MKAWVASKVPADHVANKMQNFGLGPQGVFPIWQGWCNHFTGDYRTCVCVFVCVCASVLLLLLFCCSIHACVFACAEVDPIDLKTHWPTNYYWCAIIFSFSSQFCRFFFHFSRSSRFRCRFRCRFRRNLEEFSDPSLGKCTSTGLTCGLDSACTPDETCKANGGYCVCFMPLLPPNICRFVLFCFVLLYCVVFAVVRVSVSI